MEPNTHPFISYLLTLTQSEKRGALAALRRGLGRLPGAAPEMFPYVIPFLPDSPPTWQEKAYYLVASLFAYHPKTTNDGNLGNHLAQARREGHEQALERRFVALLAAHPDDLPNYLRQIVSFLKSKEVPINWNQLLNDLQWWGHPDHGDRIRKRWATAFWRWHDSESASTPPDQNTSM
jgi:CRISPR system Cascade subunit CasB